MNCTVSPLPETNTEVHQHTCTSEFHIAEDIIEAREHPFLKRNSAHITVTTRIALGSTQSRKVFNPVKIKQRALAKRYPGRCATQIQKIRNSLWKDSLILLAEIKGQVDLTSTI